MNIIILGAAGFIGTNLAIQLAQDKDNQIKLVDYSMSYFDNIKRFGFENVSLIESSFDDKTDYDSLLTNQEIVYHLFSTTNPSTSNQDISKEIVDNVLNSSRILEACVNNKIKRIVFLSSGGTVYGREDDCPIKECAGTNPISSYGTQKLMIEKLIQLYNYNHGLDYRIIRLSNPYGPFQRPNGILGAITTFVYKAINNEEITVYGDGSVVRDFIYIDDAIRGIQNIASSESEYKLFNLGSGKGTSINEVLEIIRDTLGLPLKIKYEKARTVDIPINYLDVSRYRKCFNDYECLSLQEGIKKTKEYLLTI